jgi:hypothetical protein
MEEFLDVNRELQNLQLLCIDSPMVNLKAV